MRLKFSLLLIVLFCLTACSQQNVKPKVDLSDVLATEQRAQAAYQREDWATAEREYTYLVQQVPGQSHAWFRLGNIYARTEKLDDAIIAYRRALALNPKNSKIWHNLGVVQLRQATNTFTEMLEFTDPNDPLNSRAKHVVNSVSRLLASGFDPSKEQ